MIIRNNQKELSGNAGSHTEMSEKWRADIKVLNLMTVPSGLRMQESDRL